MHRRVAVKAAFCTGAAAAQRRARASPPVMASVPIGLHHRQWHWFESFLKRPSMGMAIRALRHDDDAHRGWAVFQHVLRLGCPVDVRLFMTMMMFCRRHLPSKAPQVLRTAVSVGVPVSNDDGLFCTFLSACQRAGRHLLDESIDVYREHGPRSHDVLFTLAHSCRVAQRPGDALFLVQDAIENAVEFSERLLSIFAACCAESTKSANVAEQLLDVIRSRRTGAPTRNHRVFANLVKVLLAESRYSRAISTLDLMDGIGLPPTEGLFNHLLCVLANAGHILQAFTVFDMMVARDVLVDSTALSQLVVKSTRLASLRVLDQYVSKHPDVLDGYVACSFISAYSRFGNIALAERVFHCIDSPDAPTYNAMVVAYCRAGMLPRAIDTFERYHVADRHPSACNSALSAFARADSIPRALFVLHAMQERNVPVTAAALCSLVAACARCSDRNTLNMLLDDARLRDDPALVSAFDSASACLSVAGV